MKLLFLEIIKVKEFSFLKIEERNMESSCDFIVRVQSRCEAGVLLLISCQYTGLRTEKFYNKERSILY